MRTNIKKSIIALISTSFACANQPFKCNGYQQLCTRRYNEVAYAATHNGQSHKESDVHNQDLPIKDQLEKGIRAIKIHIWYDQDDQGKQIPFVCHGIDKKFLYSMPIEKFLEQVPLIYKPFARACIAKVEPMKDIIHKAFQTAYGINNTCGLIPFNHCILDPARRPLLTMLGEIKQFLDTQPHEIVTIILEDHTDNLAAIMQDFADNDLLKYVHNQSIDANWPTLGEMIQTNKRLIVFFHGNEELDLDQYPWLHRIWDYAFDTPWEFKTVNDLKDEKNETIPQRGKEAFAKRHTEKNKIFIVHHFITDLIGGNKGSAKKANRRTILRNRMERLARFTKHMPNIIQVDFFEYPNNDIFDVVNELNGVGAYAGKPLYAL